MASSVLRIGPFGTNNGVTSAKLLQTALVSYFENQQEGGHTTGTSSPPAEENSKSLKLANKYFSAEILLEDIGGTTPENAKEDGIVLVFDSLESNPDYQQGRGGGGGVTFDSLALAHQQAEDADTCGDLLRLCVGVSLTDLSPEEARGKDHEKEYSRRILWYLDHGYEYVEADLSQDGQGKGHDDRDKDGFARIVEAIQGTVWSSAVMSKGKTTQLKDSYKEDALTLENNENKQDEEEEEEEENPYMPPDPSKFGGNLTNQQETAELNIPEAGNTETLEKLRKEMDEEKVFDEMEAVLREASRVRDASKSGQLTDDERRERAGEAAMRLVDLMNQFGMEDEEDNSIGEDSDDSGIAA